MHFFFFYFLTDTSTNCILFNVRYLIMKKRSKYLGIIINKWKVVDYTREKNRHRTFILKRKIGFSIKTMTVREQQLVLFARGKTIIDELGGKAYCVSKNIYVPQNTIDKNIRLSNLFRSI